MPSMTNQLDTTDCTPDDVCEEDTFSREILYCEFHYSEIMKELSIFDEELETHTPYSDEF